MDIILPDLQARGLGPLRALALAGLSATVQAQTPAPPALPGVTGTLYESRYCPPDQICPDPVVALDKARVVLTGVDGQTAGLATTWRGGAFIVSLPAGDFVLSVDAGPQVRCPTVPVRVRTTMRYVSFTCTGVAAPQ